MRIIGNSARVCATVGVFLGAAALSIALVTPVSAQTTGKVTEARHQLDLTFKAVQVGGGATAQ